MPAADNNEDEGSVTLKSKDEETFELSPEAAKLSDLVRDSIDDDERELQVLRVSSACLGKVVSFLEHHVEDPMVPIPTPLGGGSFDDIVKQEWYRDFFVDVERPMLFDLLTAANYMGVKPLLDLTCLKVTFELSGKSSEEIRIMLNLPKLTPAEEELARVEHKWVFEDS